MSVPERPKIYHIAHIDRLASIVADGGLWCDKKVKLQKISGTGIGISRIKNRRSNRPLESYPDLRVGDCVPFYFCPRSVMLFVISKKDHPDLNYRGGQGPIIHLEADLYDTVAWANQNSKRWAFTLSNAGACYSGDRNDLAKLDEINWVAVQSDKWGGDLKVGKQAEFLLENKFPWHLVERVGVQSLMIYNKVNSVLLNQVHKPLVKVCRKWYYKEYR